MQTNQLELNTAIQLNGALCHQNAALVNDSQKPNVVEFTEKQLENQHVARMMACCDCV